MLDAEYIYVMQKFCSVSNFKPKKSRVRSPDCKIFIARSSSVGSKLQAAEFNHMHQKF